MAIFRHAASDLLSISKQFCSPDQELNPSRFPKVQDIIPSSDNMNYLTQLMGINESKIKYKIIAGEILAPPVCSDPR